MRRSSRLRILVAAPAFEGYTGDIRVGDANEPDVADGALGDACGDPNVACSSGDGSGSCLNVSGAGRCFCALPIVTVSSCPSAVVDSASFDGILPFEPLRSRVDSMLDRRSVGTGGASELRLEPTVCIEPLEKRDMRDAIEYREYRYWS